MIVSTLIWDRLYYFAINFARVVLPVLARPIIKIWRGLFFANYKISYLNGSALSLGRV